MERDERTSSIGAAGVMAMACRQRRPDATREAPAVIAGVDRPATRERWAGPYGVTERSVVPRKPGNSGRGKGPQLKTGRKKRRRTWGFDDESSHPRVAFRSCRRRHMLPLRMGCESFPRAGCGKSACPVRRAGTGNRAKPNRTEATMRKRRQQPPRGYSHCAL